MLEYTGTSSYLQRRAWNEILIKFEHGKLGSVEHLVAELSISFDAENFKVNVTTW